MKLEFSYNILFSKRRIKKEYAKLCYYLLHITQYGYFVFNPTCFN